MVAFPLGISFYIWFAIKYPWLVREIQNACKMVIGAIENELPDQYAVWVPNLNLESGIVLMMFTLGAFILIELLIATARSMLNRG